MKTIFALFLINQGSIFRGEEVILSTHIPIVHINIYLE